MYKSFALLNGALVAIMILSNGLMVEAIGNTSGVLINHVIGITLAFAVFFFTNNKWHSLKGIPFFYLLAGITGLLTIAFSNIAFLSLGATVTLMLSMFGRIVTSSVIDHFGLMGMKRFPFQPKKFIGLGLMMIGVVLIFIY